jgi:hypothetical protein
MSSTTLVILAFPAFYGVVEKLRILGHKVLRKFQLNPAGTA